MIAELLGKVDGAARGLGGSMHLYKREHNFFGGEGIVGTHVRPASSLSFRFLPFITLSENCLSSHITF